MDKAAVGLIPSLTIVSWAAHTLHWVHFAVPETDLRCIDDPVCSLHPEPRLPFSARPHGLPHVPTLSAPLQLMSSCQRPVCDEVECWVCNADGRSSSHQRVTLATYT